MLNYTNELALPNISGFTKHKGEEVGVGEWWKGGVVFHEMISWWGGTVKMIEGKKVRRLNS